MHSSDRIEGACLVILAGFVPGYELRRHRHQLLRLIFDVSR
jgi:hypothetical protein